MIDKKIVLIVTAVVAVFGAGWWGGQMMNRPASTVPQSHEITHADGEAKSTAAVSEGRGMNQSSTNAGQTPANVAAVIQDIHSAMGLAPQDRVNRLPKALEKITSVPLTSAVLATLQEVIDAGELDECNYVISLMEQREEKQSVGFLVKTLDNEHPDVQERALFALEAVAGNVFASAEAAKEWASTWKPDAERAKLFSPEGIDDETADAAITIPGPRGKAKDHTKIQENPEK